MKKSLILVLCVAMIFVMTGCSGISKEDYEKVVSERDEYKTKYEAELEKNKKLDSEYAEIKQIYENIVGDNSDLGFVNELTKIRKDYEEIANHPEAHKDEMVLLSGTFIEYYTQLDDNFKMSDGSITKSFFAKDIITGFVYVVVVRKDHSNINAPNGFDSLDVLTEEMVANVSGVYFGRSIKLDNGKLIPVIYAENISLSAKLPTP